MTPCRMPVLFRLPPGLWVSRTRTPVGGCPDTQNNIGMASSTGSRLCRGAVWFRPATVRLKAQPGAHRVSHLEGSDPGRKLTAGSKLNVANGGKITTGTPQTCDASLVWSSLVWSGLVWSEGGCPLKCERCHRTQPSSGERGLTIRQLFASLRESSHGATASMPGRLGQQRRTCRLPRLGRANRGPRDDLAIATSSYSPGEPSDDVEIGAWESPPFRQGEK